MTTESVWKGAATRDPKEHPLVTNLRKKQREIEAIKRNALEDLVGAIERCPEILTHIESVRGFGPYAAWTDALALLGEEEDHPVAGILRDLAHYAFFSPDASREVSWAGRVAIEVLS